MVYKQPIWKVTIIVLTYNSKLLRQIQFHFWTSGGMWRLDTVTSYMLNAKFEFFYNFNPKIIIFIILKVSIIEI